MNYKIGDHVVVDKSNVEEWNYHGKTGIITDTDLSYGFPYLVEMDDGSPKSWSTVSGLVEGKNVFTKNDLKTGMFGVMNKDHKYFVIVGDSIIYQDGNFDRVKTLSDDLEFFTKKIDKVYEGVLSFNNLEAHLNGHATNPVTLVYDRERDTKKLYNGKVVCVENIDVNRGLYTVGKIYQFVNGKCTVDNGDELPHFSDVYSFEDWAKFTKSKFIEIKE